MKQSPMLMSTPMVQGILDDRKTITRRLQGLDRMNENPDNWKPYVGDTFKDKKGRLNQKFFNHNGFSDHAVFPYGKIGDFIWVRESFYTHQGMLSYKADYNEDQLDQLKFSGVKCKPSIHMLKTACRLWLKITNIRVERLQDISEEDAKAEGVLLSDSGNRYFNYIPGYSRVTQFVFDLRSAKASFKSLWEALAGRNSWNKNPWVWVIEFDKCEKPTSHE